MTKITMMDKYPVFTLEIAKNETTYTSVDEIIGYLKGKVEGHPVATFIGVFDHYAHTACLDDGVVTDGIKEAKNLICCFGKELMKPEVLALRPRSIGVVMGETNFVVSFLEAPNPQANDTMIGWVKGIVNQ